MKVETFDVEGLATLQPKVHRDHRGFFFEAYNRQTLAQNGIHTTFVQDNMSRSSRGTLRGLHFQRNFPQAKLVSVIEGQVFDVAVDLRQGSATYGQWQGVTLCAEQRNQFFVPRGFAHGFQVLSEWATFFYKCSEFYHPEDEEGIMWNDPALGINWPLAQQPTLSGKDSTLPLLADVKPWQRSET